DPEDAIFPEIAQKRAVVRPDIHDEVVRVQWIERSHFLRELGEVFPKNFGGAARIWVRWREKNRRINDQPELCQRAILTRQELSRIRRLLGQGGPNRRHRIYR